MFFVCIRVVPIIIEYNCELCTRWVERGFLEIFGKLGLSSAIRERINQTPMADG